MTPVSDERGVDCPKAPWLQEEPSKPPPGHCGFDDDHMPHNGCKGGPRACPGGFSPRAEEVAAAKARRNTWAKAKAASATIE